MQWQASTLSRSPDRSCHRMFDRMFDRTIRSNIQSIIHSIEHSIDHSFDRTFDRRRIRSIDRNRPSRPRTMEHSIEHSIEHSTAVRNKPPTVLRGLETETQLVGRRLLSDFSSAYHRRKREARKDSPHSAHAPRVLLPVGVGWVGLGSREGETSEGRLTRIQMWP